MKLYSNKNKFFGKIIDEHFNKNKILKKDKNNKNTNELCDVDYVYRFNYDKCNIVSQLKTTNILGNKWFQYKFLTEWYKHHKKPIPDYIPKTYLIKKNNLGKEKKFITELFTKNSKWIIKPENSSFRAGIKVVNNYKGLIDWINRYKNNRWLIQYYIDNPLQIEKKKVHFRLYVLLVKTKKETNVYIHNKGYIYSAKKTYDDKSLENDRNLSGGDSWEQMSIYPETIVRKFGVNNYMKILPQINTIIKATLRPVINNLTCVNNKVKDYKCYKLFGYDILMDNKYKLYLGEINTRTVNVKFPIENMYNDILNVVTAKQKVTQDYLNLNNLDFKKVMHMDNELSIITVEEEDIQIRKGLQGGKCNGKCKCKDKCNCKGKCKCKDKCKCKGGKLKTKNILLIILLIVGGFIIYKKYYKKKCLHP